MGFHTACVHGGEEPDPRTGAVNTPVHLSSTFLYPELADGSKAPYIYSRYENPTVEAVEAKLALLEGAESSLLFASGMAAIQAIFQSSVGPGDVVAAQQGVYGGTTAYLASELAPWGAKVVPFDPEADALPRGAKLVWMEAITNPLLRVADIPHWADAAHDAGALLAVDATFASPAIQKALELGADFAFHSATKYLSGHADVTAGAVSTALGQRPALWQRRRNLGGVLDPMAAYLVGRGMKTLGLRVERHCANAMALATALEGRPGTHAVHYPGLPGHPDHAVARRTLSGGFGGVVTIDLGSLAAAQAFRRRLQVVVPAASLGSVESLASLPAETSHAYAAPEERRRLGIGDGLVRISVGIEDIGDLVADVTQALG